MGDALHRCHYLAPHRCHEDPSAGTVPAGYHPVTIAGIPCYSNQQPPAGPSLNSDGKLQTVEIAGSEYRAAGAAVTRGPLRTLARVAGPQQSYRTEMYEAAVGAAITSDGDTQYIDNMAVTKCAHRRHLHKWPMPRSSSKRATGCNTNASLRSGSRATALRRGPTTRKNENKFGAMRKYTCSPRWPRTYPCRITIPSVPKTLRYAAGHLHVPAPKWILPRRRVATFDGAHWAS